MSADSQIELEIPVTRIDGLLEKGFSSEELYTLVAPRRTLERRRQKGERLTIAESDRVQRLERIIDHAVRVFGEADRAHRWLRKPNSALDQAVPIELLRSETGARVVEDAIGRIEYGMFS